MAVAVLAIVALVAVIRNSPVWAATEPPPVGAPVADNAGVLSSATLNALDRQLGIDNQSTQGQIAILTVRTTDGTPIAAYASNAFNQWGVGHGNANDGVLVVIAVDDHRIRIQTGTGLSTRLSNLQAQQIIDVDALPEFRLGDYDAGVIKTIVAVRADLNMPMSSTLTQAERTTGAPLAATLPGSTSHSADTDRFTMWDWAGAGVATVGVAGHWVRRLRRGRRRRSHRGEPAVYYADTNFGGGGSGGSDFGGGSSSDGGASGSW